MFDTRTMLLFFAFLKDAAGVGGALKNVAPAPGSSSGAALKVATPAPQQCTSKIKNNFRQIISCVRVY